MTGMEGPMTVIDIDVERQRIGLLPNPVVDQGEIGVRGQDPQFEVR